MSSDHYQAESTGIVIGRRQGRQAGYTEGWNAAVEACQGQIDDLQAALTAMFVIAYPALGTIQQSGDHNLQDFFVKHYEATIRQNAATLKYIPHRDPAVLNFGQAIQTTIDRWTAAAHNADSSPSP